MPEPAARISPLLLGAVLAALLVPRAASAGTQDGAVFALHAQTHTTKTPNICPSGTAPADPNSAGLPCSQYNVGHVPLNAGQDVYLVVARGNETPGIAGLSCGVSATANVGILGWNLCADLDFPNGGWPASGGGNRITWSPGTNCQRTVIGTDGVHAVAGAFYVYAYGFGDLSITRNNGISPPELTVADCAAAQSEITWAPSAVNFGQHAVGFSTCVGFVDCGCDGGFTASKVCCCPDDEPGWEKPCFDPNPEECTGSQIVVACPTDCTEACLATPTERIRWGQLKSTHGGE